MVCSVRSAAVPHPQTVFVIATPRPSRRDVFVTERKTGLLAIRQAPGRFGTCPRARRVYRLEL